MAGGGGGGGGYSNFIIQNTFLFQAGFFLDFCLLQFPTPHPHTPHPPSPPTHTQVIRSLLLGVIQVLRNAHMGGWEAGFCYAAL